MRSFSIHALGVFALSGCSLINSFDSVKPLAKDDGGAGGATGSGGKNGSGGAGGKGVGGQPDAGSDGGAGGGGGTAGTGGASGAGGTVNHVDGGDAGFVSGGPGGAIVAFSNGQLVVIDPVDGKQLSLESIGTVKGITHDSVTDLWYIFEAAPKATDPAILHVRQLRVTDGKWNEVGRASVAAPAFRATALNGRVAYLSTPGGGALDVNTLQLTLLNTEDSTKVVPVGPPQLLPAGQKQGVVGLANAGSPGGTVDVEYLSSNCAARDGGLAECDVNLTRFTVGGGASVVQGTPQVVGSVLSSGNVPFAFDSQGKNIVTVFPALVVVPSPAPGCGTYTTTGHVQKFNIQTLQSQAPVDFTIFSDRFSGAAYDPCLDVAFTQTTISDPALWAIPMGGGAVKKSCASAAVSMVVEPYTRTLIRVVQSANPEFYAIEGTATSPTLRQISLSKLPTNFAPTTVTVRQPAVLACPK